MFIDRNIGGIIIALFANQQYENQEYIFEDEKDTNFDPIKYQEVLDFIDSMKPKQEDFTNLHKAENAYIQFCRDNNLPDIANTEDIKIRALQQESEAMILISQGDIANGFPKYALANKLVLEAMSLMNEVSQNGGSFNSITWHEDLI